MKMERLKRLDRLSRDLDEPKYAEFTRARQVNFLGTKMRHLAKFNDWPMHPATFVTSYIHTPPEGFGKVMSEVKPRHALGYHSVLSPENTQAILEGVRTTYDGELTLARDLTVINVTKDQIVVREASVDDYVLPPDVTKGYIDAPRSKEKSPSDAILAGKWKGYTPPPMPTGTRARFHPGEDREALTHPRDVAAKVIKTLDL